MLMSVTYVLCCYFSFASNQSPRTQNHQFAAVGDEANERKKTQSMRNITSIGGGLRVLKIDRSLECYFNTEHNGDMRTSDLMNT